MIQIYYYTMKKAEKVSMCIKGDRDKWD